ncbi:MAG: cell division ATP-binding protein FtsE [Deltaproteobacteria bacterium CG03_land_8_20_14_0_80_45_14]|nr:MAG: cell division ATP-binding protein FtsE [Deltaproteobacteria bacterium CG03_land_8_20_14_0_80_45_14]
MNEAMIEMHHVFKTYPSQISALSDITLEILPGEFAFIVGPSGSGKSTLLRILFCAERPTSGEVVVHGIHITQPDFKKIYQLRRTMGIVSQDFKLLRDRTVNENVAFALEITGHIREEAKSKASEILRRVGLEEREGDSILALSAGEQQRVAIARALVNSPPLLLADEPTGNLDARMTLDVMEIFTDLHQKGTTIVFATQFTGLIKRYSYRAIRLLDGRKADSHKVEEVKATG